MSLLYTDKASIENYLLTDIDVSFNEQVDAWIEAASRYIDQYTNRTFAVEDESGEPESSARLFETTAAAKLLIDDAIEIDTVEIGDRYGDTFEETEDYVSLPLNGSPKTAVALKHRAWPTGTHRITAVWGYSSEVPADIKFAATVFAAGIINTQVNTGTAKKSETIGNYSVSYTDDKGIADFERALSILNSYARTTL